MWPSGSPTAIWRSMSSKKKNDTSKKSKISAKPESSPKIKANSASKSAAESKTKTKAPAKVATKTVKPGKAVAKTTTKATVVKVVKGKPQNSIKPVAKPAINKKVEKAVQEVGKVAPLVNSDSKKSAKIKDTQVGAKTSQAKATPPKVIKPVPEKKPEKSKVAVEKESVAKVQATPVKPQEPIQKDGVNGLVEESSILLAGRKILKTSFFTEVDENEDRANKKKYSSELKVPEKPTASSRRRAMSAEESPEELIERLAQELEFEVMGSQREGEEQLCTKCGSNHVSPDFRVDRDLGFCEECAAMLRLGETKEARKVDYQMSLMRKDALGEDTPRSRSDSDDDSDDDMEIDEEDLEDDL